MGRTFGLAPATVPWLPATALFFVAAASAQTIVETGGNRAFSVVPRLSSSFTFTDNVALSATSRQSDQITEISPGVRVQANSARLKGSIDYSLNNYISAQDSTRNRTQNSLLASGTFEAVDKLLYLDASATISRQSISAFGTQSVSGANINANSTETSTFRLSPYVRGKIAGVVDYTIRFAHSESQSKSDLVSSSVTNDYLARFTGAIAGPLSWSVDANRQTSQYGGLSSNKSDRVTGRLTYRYSPELSFFASVGTESSNYVAGTQETGTTSGYGADWVPSERTRLSMSRERRNFGNSHVINFSHRFPLTAIRFTDTRSVTVSPSQSGTTGQGTYYDLYFAQLASSVPDPVQRAQQVNTLLQQSGISPNAAITNGYLTSQATIQRRQEFAVVLNGLRNTATYTFFQTFSESAGAAAVPSADDFSRSPTVRTSGMSSNFSHRLSNFTSLNALSSWTRTTGSTDALKTTQRLFNLNVTTRFTPKLGGSIGLRSVVSDGSTTAYRENAVIGSLSAQF
jgi:uncharacterized protein (PEP-CTERM system associated)